MEVLGIEPRASCMLSTRSTTELHPPPRVVDYLLSHVIYLSLYDGVGKPKSIMFSSSVSETCGVTPVSQLGQEKEKWILDRKTLRSSHNPPHHGLSANCLLRQF